MMEDDKTACSLILKAMQTLV